MKINMTTTCVPRSGGSDCVGAIALSAGIFMSSPWRRTFCVAARSLAGSLGIESLRKTGHSETIPGQRSGSGKFNCQDWFVGKSGGEKIGRSGGMVA
jgi:hypothetical protein